MTVLDDAQFAEAMSWPRYGGFWRRSIAALIDYLVVLVPLYALVAGLFVLTDGGVKGHFWLNWRICQPVTLHGAPSLVRYNWQACSTSVFGLTVAEWAAGVAPAAQSGASSTLSIDLDSQNNFRLAALDVGFVELLVLMVYLFGMELSWGQTFGKGMMSVKVYDQNDKGRVGLPVWKAARRQVMKFLGPLSLTLTGGWFAFREWGVAPGVAPDFSWVEMVAAYAALILSFAWPTWIGISIALGNDPIHDRFAVTTVRMFKDQD